ncbi:MAG: RluA family pseudouridine synthase, partial [Planctomycetes bacterium]|nr:RluA family pseudouridine synthase [Planctomycetota bacterium]
MAEAPAFPDSTKHELEADAPAAGQRVDRWLASTFPELSRALLKKYIDEGRVRVRGKPAKASVRLCARDAVTVWLPPPPSEFPLPEEIALEVLYEDHAIIVLNKPPGLVVHSAPGVAKGGSIVNALLNRTDRLSREGGASRPGIVHRLDRETSGVLLVARTDAVHRNIAAQFKARVVKKEYLACVHGAPA